MALEVESEVDNELDLTQESEETLPATPTTEPAPAAPVSNDALASALQDLRTELSRTKQPVADAKQDAPMSDEEKARIWGVFNPLEKRPDFFQKFFRVGQDVPPEQVEELKGLFGEVQTGLVRQALIGARNMFEARLDEIQKQYEPLMQYYQQQQAAERRKSFDKTYPALSEPRYDTILRGVAAGLRDKKFDSQESYNKALAEGAETAIKQVIPEFSLTKPQQQQKPTGKTPRLPRSSAGGTGGTGKSTGELDIVTDDADSIF